MKSLLIVSTQKRLAISAILALFGLFLAVAVTALQARIDWHNYAAKYKASLDRPDSRCGKIIAELENSQNAPDWCHNRGVKNVANEYVCLLEKVQAIQETARQNGCPDSLDLYGKAAAADPGPLSDFVITRTSNYVLAISVFAGIGFIALFALSDVVKRLLLDSHPGWRRLSIVSSGVGGLTGFGYIVSDAYDPFPAAFLVALLSLVGTLAVAVYGRALWIWVGDGFSTPRAEPPNISAITKTASVSNEIPSSRPVSAEAYTTAPAVIAPSEDSRPISFCPACQAETEHDGPYCSLCGRNSTAAALAIKAISETKKQRNLTWLWWLLGLAFISLGLIFNTERALESLISTTIQVVVLVPLIWLATRKKK